MDELQKQKLMEKNKRLIDMVIERAKRDFPDDIAIIGLTGSFSTGDFHEKSDLDLLIINNTPRGWQISKCFILDDVGYDFYCTPWETRILSAARLESPFISHLTQIQVLYCSKPEDLQRLREYQQMALTELEKPIGENCIRRSYPYFERAKGRFADMLLNQELGPVRTAAAAMAQELIDGVNCLNNSCFRRGIKRFWEELRALPYLPERFEENYHALVKAKTVPQLREHAKAMLESALALKDRMEKELLPRPVPTGENLAGTYEELWCNYRNKVIRSTQDGNVSYAFLTALGAQGFLDEMAEELGTPAFDVMGAFSADDLPGFCERFLAIMEEYRREYDKVGLKVKKFNTFEELYKEYMG